MAWTQRAWRGALLGIPDPLMATTDQQWRFSFANVVVSSDLYVFTPLQLDYDEALSFQAIPEPSNFDVTKRHAIGNIGSIGQTDSINRDGLLDANLGGLTVDFDGAVTIPAFDGDLVAVLGGLSAAFVGEFTYRHYFDVAFSATPTWVAFEQPANFGDVVAVLGGLTVDFDGFSLPPDSTQGLLDANLSGLSVDFDGAYTSPPTFTGDIGANLASLAIDFDGTSFVSGTTGQMSANLGGLSADFDGTFEVWNTDGTSSLVLGGLTVAIEGQFTTSDATFGVLDANLSGLSVGFNGSALLPADIDILLMRRDTEGEMRAVSDSLGEMRMRIKP